MRMHLLIQSLLTYHDDPRAPEDPVIPVNVADRVQDIMVTPAADTALGTGSSVVRHDDLLISGHEEGLLVLPDRLDEKAVHVDLGLLLLLVRLEMLG